MSWKIIIPEICNVIQEELENLSFPIPIQKVCMQRGNNITENLKTVFIIINLWIGQC